MKRTTRPWLQFDVALLDDERFANTPTDLKGTWLLAYLLVARDGDICRDRARLAWLLERNGVADAVERVERLDEQGWLEDVDGGVTIRGFFKHQPVWRGASDHPEAKAERNARRPTTRAGRGARGASGAIEERRGEEITPRTPAHEAGRGGSPVSARDALLAAGLKPEIAGDVSPLHGRPGAVVD